jgi:hypothetical protein
MAALTKDTTHREFEETLGPDYSTLRYKPADVTQEDAS